MSPGQSHSLTVGVRKYVWKYLVWPGVRETLTTLRPTSPLMSEDLPTLGKPGERKSKKDGSGEGQNKCDLGSGGEGKKRAAPPPPGNGRLLFDIKPSSREKSPTLSFEVLSPQLSSLTLVDLSWEKSSSNNGAQHHIYLSNIYATFPGAFYTPAQGSLQETQ